MAVKGGNFGVINIGGVAATEITKWSYEGGIGVVEKPAAMGEAAAVYLSDGRKTGTGSLEFLWDPADAQQAAIVEGASLAIEVHETGTGVGTVKHTGTVLIGSLSKAGGDSAIMTRTASFSGVLTEGVN